MNHALLDRLTGSSDGMWRQNADHERKRETGDVTSLGDLTSPGHLI